MILAAAQSAPLNNTHENIKDHIRLANLAADNGVQMIIFPEMSITGYAREQAAAIAFEFEDLRLLPLRKLAKDRNILIVAGAPIRHQHKLYIGSFIMKPDGSLDHYFKQYLHEGEDLFFEFSFDFNPQLALENEKISLAICADIENMKHPENACKTGSTIYMPGIFYTPNGMIGLNAKLQDYALQYKFNILMANYGCESRGIASGGQSGFWDNKGNVIVQCLGLGEGLVIVEKVADGWKGKVLETSI